MSDDNGIVAGRILCEIQNVKVDPVQFGEFRLKGIPATAFGVPVVLSCIGTNPDVRSSGLVIRYVLVRCLHHRRDIGG